MSGIQYPNNRLKQLRQSRNISLRALSEKTGVDFATISFCEKGQRNFSANSLKALTDFFDVSSDYLLGKSAEEMYNDFVESIHNDFSEVKFDSKGEPYEAISDEVEEPIRSKLDILFRIKDVNDTEHLSIIYEKVASISAKEDFSTPLPIDLPEDKAPASPEALRLQNEIISLIRQINDVGSLEVLLALAKDIKTKTKDDNK